VGRSKGGGGEREGKKAGGEGGGRQMAKKSVHGRTRSNILRAGQRPT